MDFERDRVKYLELAPFADTYYLPAFICYSHSFFNRSFILFFYFKNVWPLRMKDASRKTFPASLASTHYFSTRISDLYLYSKSRNFFIKSDFYSLCHRIDIDRKIPARATLVSYLTLN